MPFSDVRAALNYAPGAIPAHRGDAPTSVTLIGVEGASLAPGSDGNYFPTHCTDLKKDGGVCQARVVKDQTACYGHLRSRAAKAAHSES